MEFQWSIDIGWALSEMIWRGRPKEKDDESKLKKAIGMKEWYKQSEHILSQFLHYDLKCNTIQLTSTTKRI